MKQERLNAKYLVMLNAAAFIENHGEEGGIYQNDYEVDIDLYLEEKKKYAKTLYLKADKFKIKYNL